MGGLRLTSAGALRDYINSPLAPDTKGKSLLRIPTIDLRTFLFKSDRAALARCRPILEDSQEGRCL